MDNKEIKNRLREEKNAELIRTIKYGGNEYYKTIKFVNNKPKFFYYGLKDNYFYEITDLSMLKHFKRFYEITEDVIY